MSFFFLLQNNVDERTDLVLTVLLFNFFVFVLHATGKELPTTFIFYCLRVVTCILLALIDIIVCRPIHRYHLSILLNIEEIGISWLLIHFRKARCLVPSKSHRLLFFLCNSESILRIHGRKHGRAISSLSLCEFAVCWVLLFLLYGIKALLGQTLFNDRWFLELRDSSLSCLGGTGRGLENIRVRQKLNALKAEITRFQCLLVKYIALRGLERRVRSLLYARKGQKIDKYLIE